MRTIVNYLRSVFCKHDNVISESPYTYEGFSTRTGIKVSIYCKKCGYHKTFWKF